MRFRAYIIVTCLQASDIFPDGSVIEAKQVKRKMVSQRDIAFREGRFDVCKESSQLNPIEMAKAQVLTARIVANCIRPDSFLYYVQKFALPGTALYPLSKMGCLGIYLAYAYYAVETGGLVLNKVQKPGPMMSLLTKIISAMERGGKVLAFPDGKGKPYILSYQFVREYGSVLLDCFFHSLSGGPPLRGDDLLHTITCIRHKLL